MNTDRCGLHDFLFGYIVQHIKVGVKTSGIKKEKTSKSSLWKLVITLGN
jgi:hypothetical protein